MHCVSLSSGLPSQLSLMCAVINTYLNCQKTISIGENTIGVNMTLEPLENKIKSVINGTAK